MRQLLHNGFANFEGIVLYPRSLMKHVVNNLVKVSCYVRLVAKSVSFQRKFAAF